MLLPSICLSILSISYAIQAPGTLKFVQIVGLLKFIEAFPETLTFFGPLKISPFLVLSLAPTNQIYGTEMRESSLMAMWCSGERVRDFCLFQNVIREIFVKKRAQRSSEKVKVSGKARVNIFIII